ncbi:MAG: LysR substrate-binding domain-containing protein [Thermaerobacter sp.]|nr:LysR substrate-binding domain-containing protein [Thermaerobacter sp.]
MSNMEIRQIQYFMTVAEELSFRRAAERLNISQPPLSQQIKKLEDELGFALFRRDTHHVTLTEAGRVFLHETRQVLDRLAQAKHHAEQIHRGAVGRLAVGFLGSTTYEIVSILRAYRQTYPTVALALRQIKMPAQLQALHEGQLDVGLMREVPSHPSLDSMPLREEPLVAALPKEHALCASEAPIELQALANEPFVMTPYRQGSSYYHRVIGCCLQSGFHPRTALEAPEILTIVALVGTGAGVALVPDSFRQFSHPNVAYRALQNPEATLPLVLVWRKDDVEPPCQNFIQVTRDIFYHDAPRHSVI